MPGHDLARHAGQQRRFAAAAFLVRVLEPVPAALRIGLLRLRRIQHHEAVRLRHLVHRRAGGEIVRGLGAAMQHHQQRPWAGIRTGWDEQLVVAAHRSEGELAGDELRRGSSCRSGRARVELVGICGFGGTFSGASGSLRPARNFAGDDIDCIACRRGAAAAIDLRGGRGQAERRLKRRGGGLQVARLGLARGLRHQACEFRVHGGYN